MERTYLWKRGLLQIRLFYFYFSRTGYFVFCREWELDMYDKVFVYSAQWSNGAYIWSHWFDPNIHENLITIFLFCSQCPYIDCLFKANIRLCFDISLISDCVLIFLWHEAVFSIYLSYQAVFVIISSLSISAIATDRYVAICHSSQVFQPSSS